jgi:hypothetical protein
MCRAVGSEKSLTLEARPALISSLGITVLIIQLPHQLLRFKITRKGATNGQEEIEEEKEEVKPGYR